MDEQEMTICECTEAISELTQDEAVDEMLTYIEVKARSMMGKLEERKREAERMQSEIQKLEKALDKACDLILEAVNQDCSIFDAVIKENYLWRTERHEWKEWCMKDE